MAFFTPDWGTGVASDTLNSELFGNVGKYNRNVHSINKTSRKRKRSKTSTKDASPHPTSEFHDNSKLMENKNSGTTNKKSLNKRRKSSNNSSFESNPKKLKATYSDLTNIGKQNKKIKSKKTKKKIVSNNEYSINNSVLSDKIPENKSFCKKNIKNSYHFEKKLIEQEKFQDHTVLEKDVVSNVDSSKTLKDVPSSHSIRRCRGKEKSLRERMLEKLKASRFRYLNEHIYTNTSTKAQEYFKADKDSYVAYHEGYKQQLARWPLNPVDKVIKSLMRKPEQLIIADFGCGDAKIARSLPHKVHSFDLIALSKEVTSCDMAHTPLDPESVDIVIFCLSLMGTNLSDYLLEANRVLKTGGHMKIVEVESRFTSVNVFIEQLRNFGFKNIGSDLSNNLFYFLDFKKISPPVKKNKLPSVSLKPCLYKKR